MQQRRQTATSNFGVSRREGHDASGFYARFQPPEISTDDEVPAPAPVAEPFVCGDARSMPEVADGSVALVVTSPPYFAGKQYEEELSRDGVPSSYLEYLQLLRDVFAECVRTLEPGGRIAVNVANLGRKPYRSLSADVIGILQDDLGLLLRGEVVWQKSEGASGSCAWGSFRSATNPVLRDITERIVIASKGRFDRARTVKQRRAAGLPHANTVMADDFMALTLDVWGIPPESARRVGHPAPFPIELPEQLIRLYTFADDLVLDPFMGSGSALAAAARLGRRYIGYDLDPTYVDLARRRVAEAVAELPAEEEREEEPAEESFEDRARREGPAGARLAEEVLVGAGFTITGRDRRIPKTGLAVSFVATDAEGDVWHVDLAGSFTAHRPGLQRSEAVWKALGRAHALRGRAGDVPLLLLTPRLPRRPGEGDTALRAAGPDAVFDVIDLLSPEARDRLQLYAKGGARSAPLPGFWDPDDLARAR
jgi:DNA modification methylase